MPKISKTIFTAALLGAQLERDGSKKSSKVACCVLGKITLLDSSIVMWQTGDKAELFTSVVAVA